MCNIAGYTGSRRAAPILIDMIRKQEKLDGGLSTGIATIHNGVLYSAKVTGDADELIKKTSALDFPGTTGIIHSRPDNNYVEYAHPFVTQNGKSAVVSNGNMCDDDTLATVRNSIARFLEYQGNINFKSAMIMHNSSYPQLHDGRYAAYGEVFAETVENCVQNGDMPYEEAMANASTKLFADVINVLINTDNPESIFVASISRPMNILTLNDGSYISTSQFGFPYVPEPDNIKSLPHMKSCIVTGHGFSVSDYPITGGTVTEYTREEYESIKEQLRQKLKDEPASMDTMGGGIITIDRSPHKLRPNVKLTYDILWDLHREGVLKTKPGKFLLPWTLDTVAPRDFFYI